VNAGAENAEEEDDCSQREKAANLAAAFVLEWSCDGGGRFLMIDDGGLCLVWGGLDTRVERESLRWGGERIAWRDGPLMR
jgi:hypothetical protein